MAMIPPMIPPAMNVVVLETGSGADACVSCVVAVECFSVLACVAVTSGDLKVSGIVDVVDVSQSKLTNVHDVYCFLTVVQHTSKTHWSRLAYIFQSMDRRRN